MQKALLLASVYLLFAYATAAQDPLKTLPDNYRLVLENDSVRVIRVHYGPHEKLPVHDHSRTPTVYVYLSDSGPVRFSHDEKPAFTLMRPTVKAGSFRVSPGRIERHAVENPNDIASDYLRVELKKVPLGIDSLAYRGNQPFSLSQSGVFEAFRSSVLTIQRIVVCVGSKPVDVRPGLLIAFAPARVKAGREDKALQPSDVIWEEADGSVAPISGPAHLLRIALT